MGDRSRVLVVGAGYLAAHIGRRLRADGHDPTLSSRRPPVTPESQGLHWAPVDIGDPARVRALVDEVEPDAAVVVHGPSDVTWCEAHPERAAAAHAGGAAHLAAALGGRRVLLVSTDNVFGGRKDSKDSNGESEPPDPANAYGRAKLAAEKELDATGAALTLRVSLVFGWDPAGLRPNFFTTSLQHLRAGRPVPVPDDHWNTPVLVDDVAAWSAALLDSPHTGVLHLGGPRRLSRAAWARHLAEACGADPTLVRPVPRTEGAYACRPRNACLHSERAEHIKELDGLAAADVLAAGEHLLSSGGTAW
ncbi:dTDP-4-dehydrorhamnose reductase [Actinacidiphila yanglinensis]|uniref:dTDP-4-dehydrorhamnose reductase n=1 Tax=Actinacidiphila yanglinensis TaxID=310779 RepID=A0A1H5TXE0_9ACTN|nr:sugar nucleotide-binding protein [Actinacidiphila yanglinensis]SEF67443.1 dTDP-4-dehydrorhamnose reductase [Actinacidiphila yanglinensis]